MSVNVARPRDYSPVTEVPGDRITREGFEMIRSRYTFARNLCRGRDVLEVACGAGQGLNYLATTARRVFGGDVSADLARRAAMVGGGPVLRLDGQALPFGTGVLDAVLLIEAIYYLPDPVQFIAECRRVLRPGGVVHVCTSNREWADFNPSPFSTRYFSAAELAELLRGGGFSVELYGAFPDTKPTLASHVVSLIKRMAVRLHLIPKTMRTKAFLKRIFLGSLVDAPASLQADGPESAPPDRLTDLADARRYKIIHAVARAA